MSTIATNNLGVFPVCSDDCIHLHMFRVEFNYNSHDSTKIDMRIIWIEDDLVIYTLKDIKSMLDDVSSTTKLMNLSDIDVACAIIKYCLVKTINVDESNYFTVKLKNSRDFIYPSVNVRNEDIPYLLLNSIRILLQKKMSLSKLDKIMTGLFRVKDVFSTFKLDDMYKLFTFVSLIKHGGNHMYIKTSHTVATTHGIRCVYRGKRGAKYVKIKGEFVPLKQVR